MTDGIDQGTSGSYPQAADLEGTTGMRAGTTTPGKTAGDSEATKPGASARDWDGRSGTA